MTGDFDGLDEADEVAVEFEDEATLTGKLDELVEVDGLTEEETDSEDWLGAAEVPELTAFSAFGALQPAVKNKSADKQIENNLRDCV